MTIPLYAAAGAGALVTSSPLPVPYPAGIVEGHLLITHLVCNDQALTPTTPADWALIYGPDGLEFGGPPFTSEVWFYAKIAAGGEAGNLNFTITGLTGDEAGGRMYRFTGASGSVEAGGVQTGDSTDITHAVVSTAAADRLCLALVTLDTATAIGAFTGATGGTWAEAVAEYTMTGRTLQLQTADKATAGTISGGTVTVGATNDFTVRTFALIPSGGSLPPITRTSRGVSW